ncbi:MAG TPA: glutamate--tRNA ligase [Steroidobacteraceae bacterium]|jgi:glutamyl-tRNA synthetase|nr:glutamate--tRNA ligase [Steroidobacteraceae bacterium]
MSAAAVVTRFAPSPTGQLHLGNARTALFNYLLARQRAGRFVLRVEDSDLARSQESFTLALYQDLGWLGLSWDEGPDRGGPHGPYLQSQRGALYAGFFERLERAGLAYACFCTDSELELANHAQRAAGRAPRYSGTCRELSAVQRASRLAEGRRASLRFRVPAGRPIEFDDLVHGPQHFLSDDIGDFIIRRQDGSAAFLFGNAVDDALMGVTLALRGEDHLSNTPRQRLLLDALSLPVPRYGHLPLLIGADGKPLSKRNGATSVQELREAGYAPLAICNQLFRLGHFIADNRLLTLEQMGATFDVTHLQRASAHFDQQQLRHWQGEWVRSLSPEQALAWLGPMLPEALAPAQASAFAAAVLPNVVLADDVRQWREVIFGETLAFEAPALQAAQAAGAEFFVAAAGVIGLRGARGEVDLTAVRQATGRKGAAFFQPLRAALTGRLHGPELAPLLAAMPPERARERLLRFARAAT